LNHKSPIYNNKSKLGGPCEVVGGRVVAHVAGTGTW